MIEKIYSSKRSWYYICESDMRNLRSVWLRPQMIDCNKMMLQESIDETIIDNYLDYEIVHEPIETSYAL